MLEPAILGLLGTMATGMVVFGLKAEHRLTNLECKVDALVEKNGIEPSACVPKNNRKKR